jgi:4-hydroxy-tetrahydrodipicolinate reductase
MINVCFAGITGWTAPPIVAAIHAADDLTLTCGVSRSAAGQELTAVTGGDVTGDIYATVGEAVTSAQVDVLVDYTSAAAVRDNAWTAVGAGVNVVIGSSGLTADDYAELDRLARDRGVGVIAAGNFSIMAAVLLPAVDLAELQGPAEARGAEVAGTRVHSVRLPSFVVSTEIVFGGPGERLILRHDPGLTPDPYVAGTLLAIRSVAAVTGVRTGLDELLFDGRGGDGPA